MGNTFIRGDENAILYQVLNNIVSNALKFSFINSIVETRIFNENNFFIIEIRDQGVGIKPELIDIVFSPFQQTLS